MKATETQKKNRKQEPCHEKVIVDEDIRSVSGLLVVGKGAAGKVIDEEKHSKGGIVNILCHVVFDPGAQFVLGMEGERKQMIPRKYLHTIENPQ